MHTLIAPLGPHVDRQTCCLRSSVVLAQLIQPGGVENGLLEWLFFRRLVHRASRSELTVQVSLFELDATYIRSPFVLGSDHLSHLAVGQGTDRGDRHPRGHPFKNRD